MSHSTFSRAAAAATLLASTAFAAYSASSTQNVVMYWGQGSNQIPLSEVCNDPNIDVVNIAFVNGFPQKVGDYPKTNFANACGGDYYPDPNDSSKNSGLLRTCPTIGPAIKICQDNGKKVLLSLGGGYPTDYYLPSQPVAKYFAEFLVGAFGPLTKEWSDAGKPRPFGDAAVDGFDLDLEAEVAEVPSKEYISANYAYFVNQLKTINPSTLISSAPQCQIPDVRLADAIKNAPFDMIFTQFYNTDSCSAKLGYTQIKQATTGFTFKDWVEWLQTNSKNPNVKLYLGLAAGPDGLPQHKDHYLKPDEANTLITKWKDLYPSNFGGVMLWEATVSARNTVNGQSYGTWMKAVLDGTFLSKYNVRTSSSSSSVRPSTTSRASSTSASASTTSSAATATATIKTLDGKCGQQGSVAYACHGYNYGSCCSQYGYCGGEQSAAGDRALYCGTGCNPLYGDCDSISSSSAKSSSSTSTRSSTVPSSSSSAHISSSSTHASSSSIKSASASATPSGSSAIHSSSASVSASHSARSSASASASHSVSSSSSAYDVSSASVPYPSGNIPYSPYPTGNQSSSVTPSIVYPAETTKQVPYPSASSSHSAPVYPVPAVSSTSCSTSSKHVPYPTGSSSVFYPPHGSSSVPYPIYNVSSTYNVPVYPDSTPAGPSSTPCSTSSKGYAASSSMPVYPGVSSSAPSYSGSSKGPEYPSYPQSSKAPEYPSYPQSSKAPEYPSYPQSNKISEYSSYEESSKKPEYPASSTTKVITTTYVDSCETGVTTKTETITQTVCNKCTKPYEDSVTSVYVCNKCGPSVVTYTITKPNTPATDVPSYPTSAPVIPAKPSSPSYGGDKPQEPAKPSQPAKPSTPSYGNEKPNYPVYSTDIKKQVDKVTSTTISIVVVTKTPIPAVPYTPVPYPSAPVNNGTGSYPTKPTGTGVPTKPSSYSPPQFTGAASRLGAGMTAVVAIVAGLLVL